MLSRDGALPDPKPEPLLRTLGGARPHLCRNVTYLATAQILDREMAERVRKHRERRNARWITVEEPLEILQHVHAPPNAPDAILLDCVTLWISNLMGRAFKDREILERVDALARHLSEPPTRVICVSNEVGSGIVPADPLGRRFRDLAGEANQRLARASHKVFWIVSGLPVEVK